MTLSNFRWYRKWKGGIWYKYQFTGQLPGLFGTIWNQEYWKPHRYYKLIKTEDYRPTEIDKL